MHDGQGMYPNSLAARELMISGAKPLKPMTPAKSYFWVEARLGEDTGALLPLEDGRYSSSLELTGLGAETGFGGATGFGGGGTSASNDEIVLSTERVAGCTQSNGGNPSRQNAQNIRSHISCPIVADFSGSISFEGIARLRRLHTLPSLHPSTAV